MIQDQFIAQYVSSLESQIIQLKYDLALANLTDMYQVGKLQGKIQGLMQAKDLVLNICEELDN